MFGTDDNMEWTRLELSIEDDLNKQKIIPDISSTGLDVTAEMMHDSFLTNLPHLDEVKISHMSMMSEISDAIESDKFLSRENKSLDLFLKGIGGTLEESKIRVPLTTKFPTEIIVETSIDRGDNLVRILSPEIFGGIIETFKIGNNQKISGGKWADNYLELQLE
ncbi:MAG: hypothetical protein CMA58_05205 [Euryarchaeota archaeon]|jgi:hypothetical protein|nr:hypothetical protein [Euryarchaeota archaeon]|tara:strand:- start:2300 stop:2791 length:492 start_codon:yes stop_codon:yes gene_type:complete